MLESDLELGRRRLKLFACEGAVEADWDREDVREEVVLRLMLKMLLQASQRSELLWKS